MSNFSELKESINKQFIPLYDSILFIAEYGKGTLKDALNLLKTKLLDKQIYLMLVDEFSLIEIKLFHDDYEAVEYDGKYITVNFILAELEKSIANNKATTDIVNYGFGAKRFYETLSNGNGIFKIDIPNEILNNALSPDCYHDIENPLTQIVQELQKENALLKQQQANPPKSNDLTESYITLDEATAYLSKILDLTFIKPIHFLERNIKQGIIIPYFEFFGFINFETPTNDYTTVIQIDEVHGYFKDWNYSLPNNEFTNLSKDEYQIVNGFVEKLFFADCHKFYGRSKNGNLHYEPNTAIELPKNTNVTFHSIRPSIDYETLLVRDNLQTRENEKVFISNNAIHFKLTEIDNLISQNSHLKVKQIPQNDNDLLKKVETQQITINSLNQELDKLRAELSAIQQVGKETKPSQSDTLAGNDPFNWQSMSINIYPPELHLAMAIWQEYYDPNLNDNSQFVTAKFNRIATNLGLINGDLKKRIRTILTSAPSKKKSQILANNLKNINILNLGDFFIDDN